MKLEDVIKLGDINDLSQSDLQILRGVVNEVMKARRGDTEAHMKAILSEGMKVTVDHKKVAGLVGTITKVNRKKAKVDFPNGSFTVPLGMIEISNK